MTNINIDAGNNESVGVKLDVLLVNYYLTSSKVLRRPLVGYVNSEYFNLIINDDSVGMLLLYIFY